MSRKHRYEDFRLRGCESLCHAGRQAPDGRRGILPGGKAERVRLGEKEVLHAFFLLKLDRSLWQKSAGGEGGGGNVERPTDWLLIWKTLDGFNRSIDLANHTSAPSRQTNKSASRICAR